ncbi:hypothetical protein BS78_03G218800 [Paspalum vaginatum]|nr:hypothetical protein BS78_03G218800 [Paspalum vaginatum]
MESGDDDRVSALPDGVREHLLSFLPAHEAVRTTVLARSWRNLWRRSPALRVTQWGSLAKFTQFVETFPRLRLSTTDEAASPVPLDFCHFDFGVTYNSGEPCMLVDEARLTLTASRHLTMFELDGVEIRNNLNLSGFPALKDLIIRFCGIYAEEIRAPYLKHLTMDNCFFRAVRRLTLRLPSVVSLELKDYEGLAPFLPSMPSLETALVSTYSDSSEADRCYLSSIDGCGDEDCHGCGDYYLSNIDPTSCVLLGGLYEATSLELAVCPEMIVFIKDLKYAQTFGKLKTLVLADWFVAADLRALIWFLNHSPMLEKLTLKVSEVSILNALV